jgi:dephospho-CoA kinase
MRIFLVAGKAGSGKGEVAKLIKEYYIYKLESCVITQFSKYLKSFAKELTDWDGNENTKPRSYLQQLGDTIRQKNPKYFVNNMIDDLSIYDGLTDNVVISDVKLPQEIEDIKLNFDNVYAIWVENQFSQSNLSVEEQSHLTETALETYDDFDYILTNDKMEALKDRVFKYLEGIK